jgi:sulfur carrier protein ThiS
MRRAFIEYPGHGVLRHSQDLPPCDACEPTCPRGELEPQNQLVVTVHLHTTLQRQTPTGMLRRLDVTLPVESTVADLMARLGIQAPQDSILLLINGRHAHAAQGLADGDEVHLIPALFGDAPISEKQQHLTPPS